MEQKTLEYNENVYRVKKMNAIEALALRSASDMKSVDAAKNHNHDSDYASISHEHTEYASSSHYHSAGSITSGTLNSLRLPYATSSSRGAVRISYSDGNLYIYTQ